MSERITGNQPLTALDVRYVWVAHSDLALALWEIVRWNNGTTTKDIAGVLLAGGPDDSGVLRFPRRLAEQQIGEPGRPQWPAEPEGWRDWRELPPPPTWAEVAEAYDDFHPPELRFFEHLARPRGADESPDAFYYRIARLYKGYARANGKPLKSIAEALGVSKGTAGNWVTAARKRGHLPPTTKGKVQS